MNNFKPGYLVLIMDVPGQSRYIKSFAGQHGLILEHVQTTVSKNIWKVLIGDITINFHSHDLKRIT